MLCLSSATPLCLPLCRPASLLPPPAITCSAPSAPPSSLPRRFTTAHRPRAPSPRQPPLTRSAFFLRADRVVDDPPVASGMPKPLQLAPSQNFDPAAHYAWFYDGDPLWTIVGGVAMVAVMLAGVMFPLWPVKLRVGVWYLSVGALGLVGAFFILAIIRLIFWCFTKVFMSKAIWMFPNLFEDVGFVSRATGPSHPITRQ